MAEDMDWFVAKANNIISLQILMLFPGFQYYCYPITGLKKMKQSHIEWSAERQTPLNISIIQYQTLVIKQRN